MFVSLLLVACRGEARKDDYFGEKVLLTQANPKGKLIKKVVAGNIAGEDKYLHIIHYDTTGKIVVKYGVDPYDQKFKEVYTYQDDEQLMQRYEFNDYGGSPSDRLFQIEDTLENFQINSHNIGSISIHRKDNRTGSEQVEYYSWDEDKRKMLDAEGNEYQNQ